MTDDLLKQIMQWGPAGVVLLLLLCRVLVTKAELTSAQEEATQWRSMYLQEQQAHRLTQEALMRERDRMDTALESSRTTESILRYLGHRPDPVAPMPPLAGGGGPQLPSGTGSS